MTARVAVLDDYQRAARSFGDWARLSGRIELTVFTDHLTDPDALVDRLAGFDVVAAMRERTPFPATILQRLPRLKLLVTTGMVNAAIDLDATRRLGVTVCGTGGSATPTAELTWTLILTLVRKVPLVTAGMNTAGGQVNGWAAPVAGDLAGRTLGVLGLGRLGSQVAAVGRAFGMDVTAWSQNLEPQRARHLGVRPVTFAELLGGSDILTVHTRLSDRTVGLIGAGELKAMRRNAYLVNTSRGAIVDTTALVTALHEGWIAGVGLDVFDVEPLPADHPLRTAPHALLTPHVGYVTQSTYATYFTETVEDIEAWLNGTPMRVL